MNAIDQTLPSTDAQPLSAAPSARIGEIEILRAIAVLLVLVHHLPLNLIFWGAPINKLFGGFWTGVDLFFAISGFVIARSLLPRLAPVRDMTSFLRIALEFWIRRAWRLMPSAWLWLTVPLGLCLVFNGSGAYGTFPANFGMFIAGLLDMANFHIAEIYSRSGSGTAFAQWSLSLEEQFYLMLPFAAFFLRGHLPKVLLAIAALGLVAPNVPLVYQIRLWPIALGVLVAIWSRHQSYRDFAPVFLADKPFTRTVLLALGVLCLVGVGTTGLHVVHFIQGPVAILSGLLVWVASYDAGYFALPRWLTRMTDYVAERSYALYLVHVPAYFAGHEMFYRLYGPVDPTVRQGIVVVLGGVLLTFILAELNYRLLEHPLRERGKIVARRFAERFADQPH